MCKTQLRGANCVRDVTATLAYHQAMHLISTILGLFEVNHDPFSLVDSWGRDLHDDWSGSVAWWPKVMDLARLMVKASSRDLGAIRSRNRNLSAPANLYQRGLCCAQIKSFTRLAVRLVSLILGPSGLWNSVCLCMWARVIEIYIVIGVDRQVDHHGSGIWLNWQFEESFSFSRLIWPQNCDLFAPMDLYERLLHSDWSRYSGWSPKVRDLSILMFNLFSQFQGHPRSKLWSIFFCGLSSMKYLFPLSSSLLPFSNLALIWENISRLSLFSSIFMHFFWFTNFLCLLDFFCCTCAEE